MEFVCWFLGGGGVVGFLGGMWGRVGFVLLNPQDKLILALNRS